MTVGAGAVAFLVAGHSLLKTVLFPFLFTASNIVCVAHIVVSGIWRHSSASPGNASENLERWIMEAGFVLVANVTLLYASYQFELLRRHAFVFRLNAILASRDVERLKKEAFSLRDDVRPPLAACLRVASKSTHSRLRLCLLGAHRGLSCCDSIRSLTMIVLHAGLLGVPNDA
jgi:hypothetical protein